MAWTSRALALLLPALLWAGPAAAGPAPEAGLFPGEAERLPAPEERDALELLFPEADLFLAPGGAPRGRVRWYGAWRNPEGFSPRRLGAGEARPPMRFEGFGLVLGAGGGLAAAGFGPGGRFAGAAFSPKEEMSAELGKLLEALAGRGAEEAAERLRVFAEVRRGGPEGAWAAAWGRLVEAFLAGRAGARPAAPPARIVPGPPGPAVATKLLVVILVIVLAGFANLALARQRRRQEAEADEAFARRMLRMRRRR